MKNATRRPSIVRRLISHHLMFGLISVVSVAAGLVALQSYWFRESRQRDLVARIGEVKTLVLRDHISHQGLGTQALVNLVAMEDHVAFAAVVSSDGVIQAHSKPNRIGQKSEFDLAALEHDLLIERRVLTGDSRVIREYWIRLQEEDHDFGAIQVGLVPDSDLAWLHGAADWLPYTALMPVGILLVGGLFLQQITRTNAAIENQLCAVSASPSPDLQVNPLSAADPAAQGWNRIVERVRGQGTPAGLQINLLQSLQSRHEQRFETILNLLPEGIALTDQDGKVLYSNRAFQVLLKPFHHGGELKGKPLRLCLPPNTQFPTHATELARPITFEIQPHATMSEGVLRVGRLPLLAEGNASVVQHIWTVRDVTQQKLAEEMRNEFICMATHELRTPLANIKAYAETLTDNDFSDVEQQKHFLNVINAEATRLSRFVEELLNVSKMEAGSMSLALTNVDLERLFTEVVEKVRPQMNQKNVTFEMSLPPKLPHLDLDKDKFAAALVNLLGNAAKYTPADGRVALKVAVAGKELQISVEDTGIGISAEELPKLFTKFFRSADARLQDIPGSGLGLAFTQEVARLHGGKLVVHSELNKGSQFILSLPLT